MILYKRKWFFFLLLMFFSVTRTFGQDPHFSQFYANPLYLNPAFAGSNNCPRFSINFRDQWPTIPNNFLTFSANYDQHINALHGGIGVLISADVVPGILQTYNAGLIYNYRVQVADNFVMQFALQAGYISSSLNKAELKLASQILNENAPNELDFLNYNSKSQFDLNFGWVGYTPYLYFGLAAHHLYPVRAGFFNYGLTQWAPKWTAHIGGKVIISQKLRNETNFGDIFFYPNMVFISQGALATEGKLNTLTGNSYYLHEGFYFQFYPFTVGGWLRHNFKNLDAFIVTCGIEYKSFKIGYSYDFNLTQLERTGGSHEVSLQFFIPCSNPTGTKKTKRAFAPVDCPKF